MNFVNPLISSVLMSGDESGTTVLYELSFTNYGIDTDAVTAIRVYPYYWAGVTYYAIEFIKNYNNLVYPARPDHLEYRTDIWILESEIDRDAEIANILSRNIYFKSPLVTASILLSGNGGGVLSTPVELLFFNNYINTTLIKTIVKRTYNWYEVLYEYLVFKFNIEDGAVIEVGEQDELIINYEAIE